jgi:hypothetical protein
MRNLVTAAAAALALTLGAAAPAFADHNDNGNGPNQGYGNNGPAYGQPYEDDGRGRGPNYGGPRGGGEHNFRGDEGRFDRWERGWRQDGFGDWRHQRQLNYWQLVRRIEFQGYYGVRGLRPARWGFGWRAFAYTGRGRPVMIRVNPYNGRVLDVRRLGYAGGFGY